MRTPKFDLRPAKGGALREAAAPEEVHIPLDGRLSQVACGDLAALGARIAESLDPGCGDRNASIAGKVTAVSEEHVSIAADAEAGVVEKADLSGLSGADLAARLKELGLDTADLVSAAVLVVGGLEPEPGVSVAGPLLAERRETLEAGLDLAKRLVAPQKTILALPEGSSAALAGCDPCSVKPTYPNSLPELTLLAATGKEAPEDAVFVAAHTLFALGRVAETGLPSSETVLGLGDDAVVAVIGTPAGALLDEAGLKADAGDRVVLGGPMRGRALYSLEQGVGPGDYGLSVISKTMFPPVADAPCLNCGECVFVCPARLMPGMLSRLAEFGLYERTLEYHIDACMDCGLCGYVCTGRRPVLQYIRLARRELALKRAADNDATNGADG